MKNKSWLKRREEEAKKELFRWCIFCVILYTFLYCFFFVWEI
jgi:hypothetical protein